MCAVHVTIHRMVQSCLTQKIIERVVYKMVLKGLPVVCLLCRLAPAVHQPRPNGKGTGSCLTVEALAGLLESKGVDSDKWWLDLQTAVVQVRTLQVSLGIFENGWSVLLFLTTGQSVWSPGLGI